ncbi:MAG TPA: hypothetical protein VKA48_04270 [Gammaproteobacteria bacterium]|nr:hypothetical protein [Gammaproteobacteria bacterium]
MAGKGGWWLAGAALAAALLAGCGGNNQDSSGSVGPSLDSLWSARLSSCSECHAPGRWQADGPDMNTQASFLADLKNKNQMDFSNWGVVATCGSIVSYIVPGKPDQSLILGTLVSSYSGQISKDNGDCTTSYSVHATRHEALDAQQDADLIDALKTWIADGAKDN